MTVSYFWTFFFWAWVASEVILGMATRTKRSTGNVHDRGSLLLLWIVIFASNTVAFWFSDNHPHNMFGGAHILRTIAVFILLAGLAVRATAIFTLGKSFSSNVAIQQSQQITRSGLYRFVRHPSYLGMLLIFTAIGLHTRNWLSFAIVLLFPTAALLYRIHVEEAALLQAFGAEYSAYSKHTNRLIPGIF